MSHHFFLFFLRAIIWVSNVLPLTWHEKKNALSWYDTDLTWACRALNFDDCLWQKQMVILMLENDTFAATITLSFQLIPINPGQFSQNLNFPWTFARKFPPIYWNFSRSLQPESPHERENGHTLNMLHFWECKQKSIGSNWLFNFTHLSISWCTGSLWAHHSIEGTKILFFPFFPPLPYPFIYSLLILPYPPSPPCSCFLLCPLLLLSPAFSVTKTSAFRALNSFCRPLPRLSSNSRAASQSS